MEKMSAKRGLTFPAQSTPHDVEITIAPNAGACFGVVRAIKLGYQAATRAEKKQDPIYSLGPLIHNSAVVDALKAKGVHTTVEPDEIENGTVILRSHGVPLPAETELRERGVKIVDATCPLVKKPQRIARSLGDRGYFLIVVGDLNHPEVKGVLSYFGRDDYLVTYHPKDLDKIPAGTQKVGVIAQTTIEGSVFRAISDRARQLFADVLVHNTICDATTIRQTEAVELARNADVLVVVGGKHSSNTNKLVKICKGFQPDTYHIEQLEEIEPLWFLHKHRIGITGGASTPHEYVDQVGDHVAGIVTRQQECSR